MITGFEEITYKITPKEQKLLNALITSLAARIGKKNAITSKEMIRKMSVYDYGVRLTAARLRKLIHFIRCKHLVRRLVSTSAGYYVAESDQEVRAYIQSLDERINAIQRMKSSLKGDLHG